MNRLEISEMLLRFINGRAKPWEFDDFISSPLNDDLEKYRLEIINIPEKYPSKSENEYCNTLGIYRIREISDEISNGDYGD